MFVVLSLNALHVLPYSWTRLVIDEYHHKLVQGMVEIFYSSSQ